LGGYQVTPLRNGKAEVFWTMAMTAKGFGNVTMALFGPFMRLGNQWMFNRFKKHVEQTVLDNKN